MTKFRVRTDRLVDVLSMHAPDVDLLDLVHPLSQLPRWGGHGLFHFSEAQHAVLVSDMFRCARGSPADLARYSKGSPREDMAAFLDNAPKAYLGVSAGPIRDLVELATTEPDEPWDGVPMLQLEMELHRQIYEAVTPVGFEEISLLHLPRAKAWASVLEYRALFPTHTRDKWYEDAIKSYGEPPAGFAVHEITYRDAAQRYLNRYSELLDRIVALT